MEREKAESVQDEGFRGVWAGRGGGVKTQITFFGKHATASGVNRRLPRERRGEERAGRAENKEKRRRSSVLPMMGASRKMSDRRLLTGSYGESSRKSLPEGQRRKRGRFIRGQEEGRGWMEGPCFVYHHSSPPLPPSPHTPLLTLVCM